MWSNTLDRISFLALFFVIVLLPVFFLPFTQTPIETGKGLLLVVGLAISIIFWAFARFSDGKISIPRSWCLLAGAGVVLAVLLSAYYSTSRQMSFFGTMFDVGTFWFIFVSVVLMFHSSIVLGNSAKARIVLFGVIVSSALVLIFQTFRFFVPELLSLGILGGKIQNLVGSWNTFGIFAGFSTLMLLFIIEFFSISKTGKFVLGILTALSVLIVAAVNFMLVWEILGIFALIIFVYKISFFSSEISENSEERKVSFPAFPFAIVVISLLFFTSSQFLGRFIPAGLSGNEAGPNFKATMSATNQVLKTGPILGTGPNTFGSAWTMYKPAAVNTTPFWNVSFEAGSGLLPTFTATTGYLGILAWFAFLVLFLVTGAKAIFLSTKRELNAEVAIFFMAALYLFVSSFFYFTGAVLFLLAMTFTGIFIGLSTTNRENGEISILFSSDHRKSFFSILFLVLLIIASAVLGFKYLERFASVSYFQKASGAETVPMAEANIKKAVSLYGSDLYLRSYSQVYLIKLSTLANEAETSEEEKADPQETFNQAENSAIMAVSFNPRNYLNLQALGSVYGTAVSLGVKDAYEKAVSAYNAASLLNPLNPTSKLALGRISLIDKKTKEARDYANEALALKADYIDALILLAQIAKSEGNNRQAVSYAEKALSFAPNNEKLKEFTDSLRAGESPSNVPDGENL